jgi:hypothetical protein
MRRQSSPGRRVEVMQFDTDYKASRHVSHLVTFAPRPEPEIEDDAHSEAQRLLGEAPQLPFDLLPGRPSQGVEPRARAIHPS